MDLSWAGRTVVFAGLFIAIAVIYVRLFRKGKHRTPSWGVSLWIILFLAMSTLLTLKSMGDSGRLWVRPQMTPFPVPDHLDIGLLTESNAVTLPEAVPYSNVNGPVVASPDRSLVAFSRLLPTGPDSYSYYAEVITTGGKRVARWREMRAIGWLRDGSLVVEESGYRNYLSGGGYYTVALDELQH